MCSTLPSTRRSLRAATETLDRHLRVRDVQLVEGDAIEAEPDAARLAGGGEVGRTAVGLNLAVRVDDTAALGGDHETVWIRGERFGDQLLGVTGPVGVGGVDQVGAELERAPEQAPGFSGVGRRAEAARTDEAEGAESEAVDGQPATKEERLRLR